MSLAADVAFNIQDANQSPKTFIVGEDTGGNFHNESVPHDGSRPITNLVNLNNSGQEWHLGAALVVAGATGSIGLAVQSQVAPNLRTGVYNGAVQLVILNSTAGSDAAACVNTGSGPYTSINAQSSGPGASLDNNTCRSNHTLQWIGSAGVTGGTVQLQGSMDGVNYVLLGTAQTVSAGVTGSYSVTGQPWRIIRATIPSAITGGGTVTCIIGSSG